MVTAGSVVSGYRIKRLLGSGGMGSVYLASNPTLPRDDALKVLSAELCRDADFRARFTREADVAATLTEHPNIVSVYNRGQTPDGQLWIAMQFVDGCDADAAVMAGTMTPWRAVHIVTAVAKALDFAHGRNVVHRDVKPANFLLSGPVGAEEQVLLGDFGIARALDDTGLTATSSFLGTLAYAAPEVLAGEAWDRRADIYSLGCALYRLLTSRSPYPNQTGPAAMIMAHLQAPPPRVTAAAPSLPEGLDQVIAIAMAKDPAHRYNSASELAVAAGAALSGQSVAPPTNTIGPAPRLMAESPERPWWHHSGSPTMMGVPAESRPVGVPANTPPQRRPRSRAAIYGALAAVVILVAAGLSVVLWPRGSSEPNPDTASSAAQSPTIPTAAAPQGLPATDVAASALRSILLTAQEIPGNTGPEAVALESERAELLNDSASIDNQACLGAWAPAQQPVYDAADPVLPTAPTGVAVQTLRNVRATALENSVTQAAVAMSSQVTAITVVRALQNQWKKCAGTTITVTPQGSAPQAWRFAQPTIIGSVLTLQATQDAGSGSCQRGIASAGNVIIDIRQCRQQGTDVATLVTATSNKVPRQ